MKLSVILFIASAALSSQVCAQKVLVVGDSISAAYGLATEEGWVALADQKLKPDYPDLEMINASISGDTTGGGVRRLPDALARFEPDVVIIELGGNDGLRGYPPASMEKNLIDMAMLSQEAGAEVLILGMMIPSNYGKAFTERFFAAFGNAATATDSALVPFFLEPIAEDRTSFQRDGIHPTAEAQPLLMDHVLPALESLLENADAS